MKKITFLGELIVTVILKIKLHNFAPKGGIINGVIYKITKIIKKIEPKLPTKLCNNSLFFDFDGNFSLLKKIDFIILYYTK